MEIASVEGGPALSAIGIDRGIDAARVLQQHHRHRVLGAPERQGGCLEAGRAAGSSSATSTGRRH